MLETFSSLAKREAIQKCIDSMSIKVIDLFMEQCNAVENDFERRRANPPLRSNEATYAGSALWVESSLRSLKHLCNQIEMSPLRLHTFLSKEQKKNIDALVANLSAYQASKFNAWKECLKDFDSSKIEQSLQEPILRKLSINSKYASLIVVNFDERLSHVYNEAHCWEKLHDRFEIPQDIHAISHKRDDLFYVHSQVMPIAKAYSEIVGKLATEECKLFVDYIRSLEKQIRPGFTKLTWSARPQMIDRYAKVN